MSELTFDSEKHEYRVGGVVLPSVTQILDSLGFISEHGKKEDAALRGTVVHQACALIIEGVEARLVLDAIPLELHGYVKSFLSPWNALAKLKYHQVVVEKPIHAFGYAGTPDIVCMSNESEVGLIIDLKSGAPMKWHALQLGGYRTILKHSFAMKPMVRLECWYLRKDGKPPRGKSHFGMTLENDWRSIVNTYWIKKGGELWS